MRCFVLAFSVLAFSSTCVFQYLYFPRPHKNVIVSCIFSVVQQCVAKRTSDATTTTQTDYYTILHLFNSLFSRTKWGKRWQGSGTQWHQLDHMQTTCTSLQTVNHTNTSSVNVYRPWRPTNSVNALKTQALINYKETTDSLSDWYVVQNGYAINLLLTAEKQHEKPIL